jgi:hypothetical protein
VAPFEDEPGTTRALSPVCSFVGVAMLAKPHPAGWFSPLKRFVRPQDGTKLVTVMDADVGAILISLGAIQWSRFSF